MFLHLFNRTNPAAEIGNLHKLLLDCFQPLMPVGVRNLSLRIVSIAPSILLVQPLKFSDFCAKAGNLIPKHFQVVHDKQHIIQIGSQVITSVRSAKQL